MKIKKYLIIPVLAMTLMTGCGNKTFDKLQWLWQVL